MAAQKPSQGRDSAVEVAVAGTQPRPLGWSGSPLPGSTAAGRFSALQGNLPGNYPGFIFPSRLPCPGGRPAGRPHPPEGREGPAATGRRLGMAERPSARAAVGAVSPAPCPAQPAAPDPTFLSYRAERHFGAKPPLRVAESRVEPFVRPLSGEGRDHRGRKWGRRGWPRLAPAAAGGLVAVAPARERRSPPFPPHPRWSRPVRAIATAGALREDGGSGLCSAAGSVSAALVPFPLPLLAPAPRPSRLPSASSPSPPGA